MASLTDHAMTAELSIIVSFVTIATSINYLCNQCMPITTKVVSSKPVHGEVYSIQHYVIKFVSNLR